MLLSNMMTALLEYLDLEKFKCIADKPYTPDPSSALTNDCKTLIKSSDNLFGNMYLNC